MARLEYRLLDESRGFPLLYYYDFIDKDEVSLRFACDYLVKDRIVYEKTSCAIEPRTYVIYVKVAEEEDALAGGTELPGRWGGIRIELREYKEGASHYPVVRVLQFQDDDDALLHLQSDYLMLDGVEWAKTSAEVDEDRKVYVYYAQPSH
ncbi:hypothetical protein [Paenibacillus flagellatus]|uniref:Uncharacterized protein n=1 Tax=Paenibacillus flagellatus TaxID=2211139 RepID=A0A2V5K0H1_9BACL|nr:hypothetical protein [Paenibacillus flagellatus]PYI52628.1 hypothetical protein DLM86_20900 [Paenibacillus flagellatus]